MANEKYFEKMRAKYNRYSYLYQSGEIEDRIALAREIGEHTSDERTVTRIINALNRMGIIDLVGLINTDIDEIAKTRNIGHEALNIIRVIKHLPTLTYAQAHPFAKTYRVYFCKPLIYGGTDGYSKDFNTLKQLSEFFKSSECDGAVITYIVEENN